MFGVDIMTGTLPLGVVGADSTVLGPDTEPAIGVVGAENDKPPAPCRTPPGEWGVPGGKGD